MVAIAVSGGADSLAAALLTRDWARGRGGDVVGLVVDHGLRGESADEMAMTRMRLRSASIASVGITLDLTHGPSLAARARDARHAALEEACADRGILHLVFGHHAADQAETVAMRMHAKSGAAGLAGMAALVETTRIRRLRPLLGVPKYLLRKTVCDAGLDWIEDPSNINPTQQRARLRAFRQDPDGKGPATLALVAAAAARGMARGIAEAGWAAELAARVSFDRFGFAIVSDGPIAPGALASLLATIGGAERPPSSDRVRALAANPRPCTIAGVRIAPAGKLGQGWLLVREEAAMAVPVPATTGTTWDGRFRLLEGAVDGTLGAWGDDAPADRRLPPAIVLRTLPVLRRGGRIYRDALELFASPPQIVFAPRHSAATAPFFPLLPVST